MEWNWDELKPKRKPNAIQKLIDAEDEKKEGGSIIRSSLYHRYFEGYRETKTVLPGGRSKIVREYAGKYYSRSCSKAAWIIWKAAYLALFAAGVFQYVFALTRAAAVNMEAYTALPGLLSAIPTVLLFATLCSYTALGRRLTIYGYNLGKRLVIISFIAAGIIAIYGICSILFTILNPESFSDTIPSVLLAFGSCICFSLIAVFELRADYIETENDQTSNDNGVIIS